MTMAVIHRGKIILATMACMILASCTGTTSGLDTLSGELSDKQRSAKIAAARKRASLKKAKRKEAFQESRKNRRSAKNGKSAKKEPKSTKVASKKRLKKGQTVRVKLKSIKGTKYAYVGGRTRGIVKRAPWKCVPKRLKIVLSQISRKFGRVIVNSTYRGRRKNRLVGGKRRSYHLRCQAVDFRVAGRTRGLAGWLARHPYVGGYNRYRSGYFHIDTGPKRTW